ncbi:hypothetical protein CERSUDRAFT_134621 [Gelatoporia subvermispora B]|uniref:TLC domain-containing protein n=1 Tax=Ceriporiopsis subvermispora (strain B) TaxID=914234 RepID=M2PNR4_CERS8|nr:hypothetical protein CERSUDRAFT_134621 [Gelatoporia subvermispora B]
MSLIVQTVSDLVTELARPLARALDLPHLPEHAPLLLASFGGFLWLHLIGAPALSRALAPVSYGTLKSRRQVNNWNIQVVSLLHVFIVLPLAVRCLDSPALAADKAFGWDPRVGQVYAVACGYFLWDVFDAVINFSGDADFLIHGKSRCSRCVSNLRPYLAYYGCRFLVWETSTIFLNIHRFLDKTGQTGTTFQWINGVLLLGTFFGARIAYGYYMTAQFWQTLYSVYTSGTMPWYYVAFYLLGNVALNSLNAIWLYKMVYALRRRFDADVKPAVETHVNGNGKFKNGKVE